MQATTVVGVAIARPPSARNTRWLAVTHTDLPEWMTEAGITLLAAQEVSARPGVVMVTSTELVKVEI